MLVLSVLTTLLACDSGPSAHELAEARLEAATAQALSAPPAPAGADLGTQVYQARCASCHGPEGRGDGPAAVALTPPPTDLTGPRPESRRGEPGGRRKVIEEGIPGTVMVGYRDVLTPEELDAVVGFVHALRHGGDATTAGACQDADCAGGQRARDGTGAGCDGEPCGPGGGGGMGGGGMGGGGMGAGGGMGGGDG